MEVVLYWHHNQLTISINTNKNIHIADLLKEEKNLDN